MPRKRIGPEARIGSVNKELAEELAAELKSNREFGQPVIYELDDLTTGTYRYSQSKLGGQ